MNKIKITFEIDSGPKRERCLSTFEKLIRAFMRLANKLHRRETSELVRLIVIVFALVAQTYLLIWVLTFVLNRP